MLVRVLVLRRILSGLVTALIHYKTVIFNNVGILLTRAFQANFGIVYEKMLLVVNCIVFIALTLLHGTPQSFGEPLVGVKVIFYCLIHALSELGLRSLDLIWSGVFW